VLCAAADNSSSGLYWHIQTPEEELIGFSLAEHSKVMGARRVSRIPPVPITFSSTESITNYQLLA
jgi:hypothetical protein